MRPLRFLTGKGGVGKSTLAAFFAKEAAKAQKKIFVATLDDPTVISHELDLPFENNSRSFSLITTQHLTPHQCFQEYLLTKLKFQPLVKLVANNAVFQAFTNFTPGIDALTSTGKIFETVRGEEFDHVLVDAVSTGHFVTWLNTAESFERLIPIGPVHRDAKKMRTMFHDPDITEVCVVTLPTELALEEAIELTEEIKLAGFPLGPVFVNGFHPKSDSTDDSTLEGFFGKRREQEEKLLSHFPYPFERFEWHPS